MLGNLKKMVDYVFPSASIESVYQPVSLEEAEKNAAYIAVNIAFRTALEMGLATVEDYPLYLSAGLNMFCSENSESVSL